MYLQEIRVSDYQAGRKGASGGGGLGTGLSLGGGLMGGGTQGTGLGGGGGECTLTTSLTYSTYIICLFLHWLFLL